jgi:hypothetical protein
MSASRSYHLEEISGDNFSSLGGAQQAATGFLADALTETIRRMLQDGRLTVHNGRIVPARHRK